MYWGRYYSGIIGKGMDSWWWGLVWRWWSLICLFRKGYRWSVGEQKIWRRKRMSSSCIGRIISPKGLGIWCTRRGWIGRNGMLEIKEKWMIKINNNKFNLALRNKVTSTTIPIRHLPTTPKHHRSSNNSTTHKLIGT